MLKKIYLLLLINACFLQAPVLAQSGLSKGDVVKNLPIKKLLNEQKQVASFSDVKNKITILDFFGTWCIPCLKALPRLQGLNEKFKADLNVVLIGNESEAQLAKFVKARPNFAFPVVVDEDNVWYNAFQPPALPYTVVVDAAGKIIAITEVEAITPELVQQWLQQPQAAGRTVANETKTETKPTMSTNQKSSNRLVQLSQDYLYATKTGSDAEALFAQLRQLDYGSLVSSLQTDNQKKAFWINLYNAYTQYFLRKNPDQYKDRGSFFKAKQINVAGKMFSLDDIEHGILRRSKIKWSLGHLNKLFPSKTEKELRVEKLDYRIHFALNCGAKSCPPIAYYNDNTLDAQLNLATKAYLSGEAEYDSAANTVKVPKLMSWFRRDFGGKKGIINILKGNGVLPAGVKPKIEFKDYDWNLYLDNFKNL